MESSCYILDKRLNEKIVNKMGAKIKLKKTTEKITNFFIVCSPTVPTKNNFS